MPRHSRPSITPTILLPSASQPHYLHHHSPAYGLLEPRPIPTTRGTTSSPPCSPQSSHPTRRFSSSHGHGHARGAAARFDFVAKPQRRHRRSTSSFGKSVGLPLVVPAWSEVEAGFKELRGRGYEIGAGIGEFGEKLSHRVPGFKGSVAFLSTLGTNIHLASSSQPPSPYLRPFSPSPLPSPLPPLTIPTIIMPNTAATTSSPEAKPSTPDLSAIPELVYSRADTTSTRTDALKLIADSVAQKRQKSALVLVWSPLFFSAVILTLAIAQHFVYKTSSDLPVFFTTAAGIVMAFLVAVRGQVAGYLRQAEAINWKWLGSDELFIAEFGDDIIGAVAYRVADETASAADAAGKPLTASSTSTASGGSEPRRRGAVAKPAPSAAKNTAILRAWTVRRRERGRGVGRGLLEALVSTCFRDLGCESARFAQMPGGARTKGGAGGTEDGGAAAEPTRAGAERAVAGWLGRLCGVDAMLAKEEHRAKTCLESVVQEEIGGEGGGETG